MLLIIYIYLDGDGDGDGDDESIRSRLKESYKKTENYLLRFEYL